MGEAPASPAIAETKVFKTGVGTITLNDASGAGGITIETSDGKKIVMNSQGIEINSGQGTIKIDGSVPEPQLTPDQEAAIDEADNPNAENPFITRAELPLGVTPAQKDALDGANQPSVDNPVATLADLGQAGVTTRVVAAGTLDLSELMPSQTLGELKVVDNRPDLGLATLSFAGYKLDQKDNYIVKALPVNAQAEQMLRGFTVVQFVSFDDEGFVLQTAQPLAETFALGHCMIEISEILTEMVEPPSPSIEQAIRYYYSLIQQKRYEQAWVMLSDRFKAALGVTTLEGYIGEWEKSGAAILLGLEAVQKDNNDATFILDLHYPSGPVTHKIRYEFVRDEDQGHRRFGYWLFERGNFVE
jgi:hypothetical protein